MSVRVCLSLFCQALIVAMGFHEKGRSLMKKKQFEKALCHLLQADHHFRCVSVLSGLASWLDVLELLGPGGLVLT